MHVSLPSLPIVSLAAERGVPGVRFFPLQRMGRAAERWETLAPSPEAYAAAYRFLYHDWPSDGVAVSRGLPGLELEPPEGEMWCRLGRGLLVDARGDVYPCSMLAEPQFRLGNVSGMRLAEALGCEKLRELVRTCERRVEEIAACASCAWRHFCQPH